MSFLDDASRAEMCAQLVQKYDAKLAFTVLIERVENMTGKRLGQVRTDRANQYMSKDLESYFATKGVGHQPPCLIAQN